MWRFSQIEKIGSIITDTQAQFTSNRGPIAWLTADAHVINCLLSLESTVSYKDECSTYMGLRSRIASPRGRYHTNYLAHAHQSERPNYLNTWTLTGSPNNTSDLLRSSFE
jgi:hypothetical protein